MDRSNRVTFKTNPELVKMLRNLQLFYGISTRSKLLQGLVPEAILAIYLSPMPDDLSASQKRAYKRIIKDVDSVRKELKKKQTKFSKPKRKPKRLVTLIKEYEDEEYA